MPWFNCKYGYKSCTVIRSNYKDTLQDSFVQRASFSENLLACLLILTVLNFWKFTSYCSLRPLWSGMGEVVLVSASLTLHPPSPPTVHQLSWLALPVLALFLHIWVTYTVGELGSGYICPAQKSLVLGKPTCSVSSPEHDRKLLSHKECIVYWQSVGIALMDSIVLVITCRF